MRATQLDRIEAELTRALQLLESGDVADILVGMHTITMIRDVEATFLALPKLQELGARGDPQVSKQAKVAAQRLEERLRRVSV